MPLTPRSLLGEGMMSLKDVDIFHILRIFYMVLIDWTGDIRVKSDWNAEYDLNTAVMVNGRNLLF